MKTEKTLLRMTMLQKTRCGFSCLRTFLLTVLAAAFSSVCLADAATEATVEEASTAIQQGVRPSIKEASEDLNFMGTFAKAINTMQANSSEPPDSVEFRTSFQFWANHHYFWFR